MCAQAMDSRGGEFHPLTAERWPDLVEFFGLSRNTRYCWCMAWRETSTVFAKMQDDERGQALEGIVAAGTPTGLLAYVDGKPAGWCSIAPRETYKRLERSNKFQQADPRRTWSLMCLFVHPKMRGRHLSRQLVQAAIEYARSRGAEVVEAYPGEPRDGGAVTSYSHLGVVSTFKSAGFEEVGRVGPDRPIMRYVISSSSSNRRQPGG